MAAKRGWIGVDFDGTAHKYNGWKNGGALGGPVPLMIERIKHWLASGTEVRIFTARVSGRDAEETAFERKRIQDWCVEHIGQVLTVTHEKDYQMVALFDDRAHRVEENTGEIMTERLQKLLDESMAREEAVRAKLLHAEQELDTAKLVIASLHAEYGTGENEPVRKD